MRNLGTVLGAFAVLGFLVGCGGGGNHTVVSARPPASALTEGLNILDASDPTWGFSAAYVKGGHVVYFESRVGAQKPEMYRFAWPDDPPNEMDARYVDENGETFALRIGGDGLVDPTWAPDIKAAKANRKGHIHPVLRALSFQLTGEMSKALGEHLGTDVPPEFKDHVFHSVGLGHNELPNVTADELAAKAREFLSVQHPVAESTDADWNYYYVQQYSGTVIYIPGYPAACSGLSMGGCNGTYDESWHTAERFWNDQYNNNNQFWSEYVDACNHGRCAYDFMTYGGARWGNASWIYNNEVDTLSLQSPNSDNSGTGVNGACGTPYNWDSGNGSHLCNDDAAFEVWQMDTGYAQPSYNGTNPSYVFQISFPYTGWWFWSCSSNNDTQTLTCGGNGNDYRDWLPPCNAL